MNKLTTLTLLALGTVALSACGGGGGSGAGSSPDKPGYYQSVHFEVSGPIHNGSGQGSANIVINNADELNNAATLNGATSVDVDATISVSLSTSDGFSLSEVQHLTRTVTATQALNAQDLPEGSVRYTVPYQGHTVTITASAELFQGNLREDRDVVEADDSELGDFFITNEGTGVQDWATLRPDYQSALQHGATQDQIDQVREAHSQGWTGLGVNVSKNANAGSATISYIAPGASVHTRTGTHSEAYTVWRPGTANTAENNYDTNSQLVAGATALTLHKFHSLTASQGGDIVHRTRDTNGQVSIRRALSPVGNLR